tara:strand:+ start:94 stop:1221 length:1128 start_codon:yes stop_codon:yes gene_type:complete
MSTHDYVIANASGSSVRSDLNNALAAIVSNNSSSSEPSTTYAYMLWADTTNGILKIRNSANNAWVELLQLDGTLTMEDGAEATPGLAFRDDLNTGIWSSGADTLDISTGGSKRVTINSSGLGVGCSPSREFHVKGLDGTIRLESTAATGRTWIEFFDTSAIKGSIGYPSSGNNNLAIQQSENADMYFTTNDTERLRIDNTGVITSKGGEGLDAQIHLYADEGDDNPDKWKVVVSEDASRFRLMNYNSGGWETNIEFNGDNNVELYYDNSKKLETTSGGITVTGAVTETSDIALKTNIEPIDNVLDKIKQITGYTYQFKDTGHDSIGVTAQDVEKVFPELVHGKEGAKTLQYSGLIGALIESIKELSNKVAALEAK